MTAHPDECVHAHVCVHVDLSSPQSKQPAPSNIEMKLVNLWQHGSADQSYVVEGGKEGGKAAQRA